jgi:hypothetical protein
VTSRLYAPLEAPVARLDEHVVRSAQRGPRRQPIRSELPAQRDWQKRQQPGANQQCHPPGRGIVPDRATQPDPPLTGPVVAYQFAADDPVVLGFRLPTKRGESSRVETQTQGRIAEDRIHAGRVGSGVEAEAMTGAIWMPSNEQHRRATPRRGEWALLGYADPELPVLAIGEGSDEAAGPPNSLAAQQQVTAIGEQVAHQKLAQDIAEPVSVKVVAA